MISSRTSRYVNTGLWSELRPLTEVSLYFRYFPNRAIQCSTRILSPDSTNYEEWGSMVQTTFFVSEENSCKCDEDY